MASDKFPEFASEQNIPWFEVPAAEFKAMITQTIFAVSDDETRYFMNGVYFEKKEENLVMVATDEQQRKPKNFKSNSQEQAPRLNSNKPILSVQAYGLGAFSPKPFFR